MSSTGHVALGTILLRYTPAGPLHFLELPYGCEDQSPELWREKLALVLRRTAFWEPYNHRVTQSEKEKCTGTGSGRPLLPISQHTEDVVSIKGIS